MEKITEKIAALPPDSNYFSLEFFPPKTRMGFANLSARLERMAQALRPLFVTVTWGAGGSTAARSLELAEVCQRQLQLTTVLHLTCTNMSRALVDMALEEAKVLGIRNILALRGDPPRSEEYNIHGEDDSNKDFNFAVDLVQYIRKTHGDYFCLGVAAYPEGHPADSFQDVQDPKRDLPYLVEKTLAGADFIMTQLTYDVEAYQKFEDMLRNHESGVFKTIPIIPGLMPIQSYKNLTRVTKLSHVHIPDAIAKRVEEVKYDDDAVKRVGVDIVSEVVGGIKELKSPCPRGFHFYTLNLEKTVSFILERADLIPPSTEMGDESAVGDIDGHLSLDNVPTRSLARRRASSINSQPHNRVIVDKLSAESSHNSVHEATAGSAGLPAMPPGRGTTLQISEGLGALGREATWDDFPNGRWGDARSPAFGEIDGYGPSLHVTSVVARKLWGHPVDHSDINTLFRRHVSGELYMIPWSEGGAEEGSAGLNPETELIRPELLKLIDGRGWWTLASQPAANGVRSDDPIFGWGPQREGFVFQKPFVEFFCPNKDFTTILKPLFEKHGHEKLTWFATNGKGEFESSLPVSSDDVDPEELNPEGGANAVTWGVFRGKEILTPTIIEEVSFRAWGEEAFRIWDEWRRIYHRGSATERFLDSSKDDSWLVCVVGQQFGAGTEHGSKEEEDEVKWMWRALAGEIQ
ncbi:Methylenetetrahydrofolate reductase 2 [Penicillium taxi]|uniref:Methylenetetrahydrofolate reductase 2 n=1 Tax=Penicillium taxi TaxID=168475 RepID=UPI0025457E4E|nr:Methylenetetrahydrofolate reductase 2 [Penicillium taxi]KAJ5908577.1 Methylenetetrahydrofolate reductase 2 [Penicillium taxi]